jgi:hypothetical protein
MTGNLRLTPWGDQENQGSTLENAVCNNWKG